MSMSYPEYMMQFKRTMGAMGRELPAVMGPVGEMHKGAMSDGALSIKVKELIALAVAVSAQCEACIAWHSNDVMEAGATREEIMEALGVVVLMGGSPAVAHAVKALEAMKQFEEKKQQG